MAPVDDNTVEKFRALFEGSDYSHGLWHKNNQAETIKSPATTEDFQRHLAGTVGLGIVPVRKYSVCSWGAIDIDVDTINHQEVFNAIQQRRLPLSVCRSKSGGAHLYVFLPDPGIPSTQVRALLARWAALLGYLHAEIFPKQNGVSPKNLGNWINLPYFGGDETTRYAVGPKGALTLDEFLASIVYYDPSHAPVEVAISSNGDADMPPCLACLSKTGLPEGMRNQALFNFGIFLRKSNPEGWRNDFRAFAEANVHPPLSMRETERIATSVNTKTYQYTCEQSPIRELCDRATCLTRKFGVAHKPWEDPSQYDPFFPTRLRKQETTPPRYFLEVNGRDIELSPEELFNHRKLTLALKVQFDLFIAPMKQGRWDLMCKELVQSLERIAAPPEASASGQVLEAFDDFVALRGRARDRRDIIMHGVPVGVKEDDSVWFRFIDFKRFLMPRRLDAVLSNAELYALLQRRGCSFRKESILGKKINLAKLPIALVNEQTEDFPTALAANATPEEDV